jgi:SARP family transcriptional regulator, regulator of embCAB operon
MIMLEFCVLGPIEIRGAKRRVRPRGVLQCTLLAILLANDNALVTTDDLINEMWPDQLPAKVENALQAHVSRFRGVLASLEPEARDSRLITHASGYQLRVVDNELDGTKFLRGLERQLGVRDLTDPEQEARELRELLGLWRGPVFGGRVASVTCRAAASRYEEARLALLERLLEAELRNGRYLEIVTELQAVLAKHFFKEKFWQQLMEALYRLGRYDDVLRAYNMLSARMANELGLEPSPATQIYERIILSRNFGNVARTFPSADGAENVYVQGAWTI